MTTPDEKSPLSHEEHALTRATLDACVKCTICESSCPVAAVTPLFSGPKFVGPQAERFRNGESVDHSLDYCSSCGICTLNCPQGVQIAELNSQARAVMKAQDGMPVRDRLIVNTVLMGRAMTPVAPIANRVLANHAARLIMEKTVGVHRKAPMPTARGRSFEGWLKKHEPAKAPTRGPVVFFHGCAGGWFEVETSIKTVEVLEHLGYEVLVPKQGCCGLAKQSNGLFDGARHDVRKLCAALRSAGTELTIVSSSGSCAGMLKHEAHEILGVDDPELLDVGTRMRETSEFLLELVDNGEFPVDDLRPIKARLPYHAPCQLRGQGMGSPAITLMELIPGLEVIESEAQCCGIAGTYGLKKEKYEIAQAVGKPVFEMVKASGAKLGACDTETCRWQIQGSTGVTMVHPVHLLHAALELSELPEI